MIKSILPFKVIVGFVRTTLACSTQIFNVVFIFSDPTVLDNSFLERTSAFERVSHAKDGCSLKLSDRIVNTEFDHHRA